MTSQHQVARVKMAVEHGWYILVPLVIGCIAVLFYKLATVPDTIKERSLE